MRRRKRRDEDRKRDRSPLSAETGREREKSASSGEDNVECVAGINPEGVAKGSSVSVVRGRMTKVGAIYIQS